MISKSEIGITVPILQMLKWSQREITGVPKAAEPVNGKTENKRAGLQLTRLLFMQGLFFAYSASRFFLGRQ